MGNHAYKCSYNLSQSCWTVYTGNFPSIPSTPHATEVFSLVPKILFFINWILVKQLYLWELEILNLLTGSLRSGEEESLIFFTVLCSLLISCQNGMCLPSLTDTATGPGQGNLCQQPLYEQNLHISPWELFFKNTSFKENSSHKISWLTEVSCSQHWFQQHYTRNKWNCFWWHDVTCIGHIPGNREPALWLFEKKKWSESESATVPAKRGGKKRKEERNSHRVGSGKIRCWFENTEAMDWNPKRLLVYFLAAAIIILCLLPSLLCHGCH